MTTTTLSKDHAAVARMIGAYRADAISAVAANVGHDRTVADTARDEATTAADAAVATITRTLSGTKARAILDAADEYRDAILADPDRDRHMTDRLLRRQRIAPLLEETTDDATPSDDATALADALACVRYLAKIIREDGNWGDDEPCGLEWADRIAGRYEQVNGEGNWGPSVGDEAVIALTPETIAAIGDGEDEVAPHNGRRVRVKAFDYSIETQRWDVAIVDVIDGPESGAELWIEHRDLARPTDAR